MLPVHARKAKREKVSVPGAVFWDLFGFADQVLAERPRASGA
jgi:hypothetical protein